MASMKRWPIGLQSSVTGDPQGMGDVIRELTENNIATFSASTDSFSLLTDLQVAREGNPRVPHAGNFTPTGFVDGYHLNVPVYGQPASVELAVRHWNKVEQRTPINDPARSPIKWSVPCIWISTWNEVRPYVGWSEQGRAHTEADQPVDGYAGNADLIGWQAVEIGKEAIKRGYRWAAFGFAGGNPEEGFWDEPGVLEYLRLCDRFPEQLGIALHEYSLDDSVLNKPDMIGRFQRLHDACDRHGIRRPVIQIKEFGWQATLIPKDQDDVIAKLVEVARIYMEHPNIHGAALWTVQKWQGSKIHQQVRALIPRLREAALQHAQEIRELRQPSPRPGASARTPEPFTPPVPTDPTPPDNAGSVRRPAGEWPYAILSASPEDAAAKLEVTTDEFGIEVSQAQEDLLNWSQLKKDGVRFVFIRVGTGHMVQDLFYMRNVRGCLDNGISFGNVFTLFEDADILQQARMFVHQADWRSALPPVVDIQRPNLTAEQVRAFVAEFHRLIDSPPIMIHTTASLWNTVMPKTETWPSAHPLWVDDFGARAPALPHHWDRWLFFEPGVKKGLRGYPSAAEDPAGLDYSHFNGPLEELGLPDPPPVHVRAVAFNDYIPFDAPIGTAEERRTKKMWPGAWIDANPFKTDYTNPTTGKDAYHTGSDLNHVNDMGMPVYAAADGTVVFAGQKHVWAGLIVIRHSPTLYSRYGHVADIKVEAGQAVVRGRQIASVGQDEGAGPFHLHFDISQSDVLEAKPEHWPGCDLAAVEKHYVNPKDYIERHRPQDIEPPRGRRLRVPTQFGIVTAPRGANFRSEPSDAGGQATVLFALPKGTEVGIYRLLDNGWYHGRVRNQDGFVFADLISDLPAPEPDTSLFRTGMNINPDAPHSNPFDSDILKGMDWVRLVFKIDARQKPEERGNLDAAFAQYDPIIRAYHAEGVGALIILNQETREGNPAVAGTDWPLFTREFADTAGKIAAHYRDLADGMAYELWNEGDLKNNPASVFLEPGHYAPLLKSAAEAIHTAAPAAQVIFGGLASGPLNGVAYVKAVREKLGGKLPVDAIGIHPYGRWVTKPPFDGWGFGTLKDALEFYRANLPGQKLWITEIGIAEDNELGPEHYPAIARYVSDVFTETGRRFSDLVPVLIWFAWSDHMRNAGIVKRDGSAKEQIFDAFRQVRDRTIFA